MSEAPLLYDVADGIATITLNRPEQRNAVSLQMIDLWRAALAESRTDPKVRVVIVTAAGQKAFCAGGDMSGGRLGSDEAAKESYPEYRTETRDTIHGIAREVRLLDKPYLAALNGVAAGAGMDLASMADLRFASETARFSMAYVRVGVVPGDGGAFYLPRLVGLSRALHLIWTGEAFSAQQALEWGYVSSVYPPDQLLPAVRAYAQQLADGPAVAIQLAKKMVYEGLESTEQQALDLAAVMMAMTMSTDDAKEGPAAFVERRPPRFTGR